MDYLTKFTQFKNEYNEDCFLYSTKNDAGQFVNFKITKDFNKYFWLTFYVSSKKKRGFETLRTTGKDGIKSLIWAKNCLASFIDEHCINGDLIICYWDDKRRKDVYAYGLRSLGFHFGRYEGKEYLLLKVKK